MDVRPLTDESLDDFGSLLDCQPDSAGCWCMWFIRRVADFHAEGSDGNRSALTELMQRDPAPIGYLAYDGDEPVGWCAAGPRSRYARAIKAPTLRGRDEAEDDTVWLAPCFLIHPDHRRRGVATALLEHAVGAASAHEARAVEGFPLAGERQRSAGSDFMTGTEPLFESCGFVAIRRPSNNRVIMRRELDATSAT